MHEKVRCADVDTEADGTDTHQSVAELVFDGVSTLDYGTPARCMTRADATHR